MGKQDTQQMAWNSKYALGVLVWLAAAAALVLAWVAAARGDAFGYDSGFWFGTAMTLGILSIPLKLEHRCGSCG